jgi:hypothetical protein
VVPETLIEATRSLVAATGNSATRLGLSPLASGGNNRVFLVEAGLTRYVAKWYFHDTGDARDRARAEFEFLSHIRAFGIRNVPKPIALDSPHHLALYEYIAGRPVKAGDISPVLIDEAARLFATINAVTIRASGVRLQSASDACFTIGEHIRSVDRRIERLSAIQQKSATDSDAAAFVTQMSVAWNGLKNRLLRDFPGIDDELPDSWRSLSPSDFGFHNALLRDNGEICFLDFEYAGWDDPAKMVGDFFAHPGLPVPGDFFERFATGSLLPFDRRDELIARVNHLSAVSRVRWCCIMLNEFLPEVASRRQFANPTADIGERKRQQLEKARSLFALNIK